MLDWFLFEVQVLRLLVSTKHKCLLVNRWQATRFCFDLPTTTMMINVTPKHWNTVTPKHRNTETPKHRYTETETLAGQQMASNEILLRPSNNNNNDDDDERNKPTSNSFSPFIEKVFLFTYLLTLLGSFISFYHFFLDLWILLSSKLKLVFFFVFGQYFFLAWPIQLWRVIVWHTSTNNYNLSQWNLADI